MVMPSNANCFLRPASCPAVQSEVRWNAMAAVAFIALSFASSSGVNVSLPGTPEASPFGPVEKTFPDARSARPFFATVAADSAAETALVEVATATRAAATIASTFFFDKNIYYSNCLCEI